jgi:hypothetical protein
VVATSEGAHLVRPLGKFAECLEQVRVTVGQRFQARLEGPCSRHKHSLIGVLAAPHRDIPGDLVENLLQGFLIQMVGRN